MTRFGASGILSLGSLAPSWADRDPGIDQLNAAPNNRFTQGGLIGVFRVARQTIEAAIEEVLAGKATPQEALDNAAQTVTEAIEEYNLTMGIQ